MSHHRGPPLRLGGIYRIVDGAADKRLRGLPCILTRLPLGSLGIVKILVLGRVTSIFAQELEEVA